MVEDDLWIHLSASPLPLLPSPRPRRRRHGNVVCYCRDDVVEVSAHAT